MAEVLVIDGMVVEVGVDVVSVTMVVEINFIHAFQYPV